MERKIGTICRKSARKILEEKESCVRVEKENLEELMEYIKAHAVQYRLPEKKGKEGRDRIIGLSTCSNDQTNGRVILYGFLYDVDR